MWGCLRRCRCEISGLSWAFLLVVMSLGFMVYGSTFRESITQQPIQGDHLIQHMVYEPNGTRAGVLTSTYWTKPDLYQAYVLYLISRLLLGMGLFLCWFILAKRVMNLVSAGLGSRLPHYHRVACTDWVKGFIMTLIVSGLICWMALYFMDFEQPEPLYLTSPRWKLPDEMVYLSDVTCTHNQLRVESRQQERDYHCLTYGEQLQDWEGARELRYRWVTYWVIFEFLIWVVCGYVYVRWRRWYDEHVQDAPDTQPPSPISHHVTPPPPPGTNWEVIDLNEDDGGDDGQTISQ